MENARVGCREDRCSAVKSTPITARQCGILRSSRPLASKRGVAMGSVVSMVRNSSEAGGRDRFECSHSAWELLIEIGKEFGWKPRGTTYMPIDGEDRSATIVLHDYRAGDSRDRKYIDADDARAWAAALVSARGSLRLAAILKVRPELAMERRNDDPLPARFVTAEFIDEFAEYAFGGVFSFANAA